MYYIFVGFCGISSQFILLQACKFDIIHSKAEPSLQRGFKGLIPSPEVGGSEKIAERERYNLLMVVKKCQNLTFKVNDLCQKSLNLSEFFFKKEY